MKFFVLGGVDGTGVYIRCREGEGVLDFYLEQCNKLAAAAIRGHLDREFNARIESIRRAAYEAGWADAKKKVKRKHEFYGCINGDSVGY